MDRLRAILSNPETNLPQLSKRSRVPRERLDALAEGASATMAEVRAIASALHLSLSDFARTATSESPSQMLFRQAIVGGHAINDEVRLNLSRRVSDPVSLLSGRVRLGFSWQHLFRPGIENAEANAEKFRRQFCGNDQFSPLTRLPQIVERALGVLILVIHTNAVDGASGYLEEIPFVLVAARSFAPRMLFTLAHEVGHILLHHSPDRAGVIIDQTTDWRSSIAENNHEREANEFASALLMPAQSVGVALKSARDALGQANEELGDLEINFLSRLYGVSFSAAALRCERLGLLPRGGAIAIINAVNDENDSAEKRGNNAGLPPRSPIVFPKVPSALLEGAVSLVRAGEMSIGRAASVLEVSIDDLMAGNIGGRA